MLARRAFRDRLVMMAPLARKARRVPWVHKDRPANPDHQDQQATTAMPAQQASPDPKDRKDHPVIQDR